MKVYVTRPIPQAGLARMRGAGLEVVVSPHPGMQTPDQVRSGAAGADGVLSLLTERIDAAVMDAAPDLRVVSNMAVGYDNIAVAEASRRSIMVCNTPGVLTETTADFTWTLILAVARRVVEGDRMLRAGEFDGWGPLMLLGSDIVGATLGIVGLGRIGQAVARRAAGFDMRVVFYSPHGTDTRLQLGHQFAHRAGTLDELLLQSDFVSLHVPLTEDTRHMIGAAQLALMKPTAYLINTSRGPVVDEGALAEALRRGILAGAALDVYEREPEVHPALRELPNAVLCPHIASASVATRNRMATMAADNLIRALSGQRPRHLVNPEVLAQGVPGTPGSPSPR